MTLVDIEGVLHTELKADQLQRRNIEAPKPGSQIDRDAIHVGGWVPGRNSLALSVDFVHDGKVPDAGEFELLVQAVFEDESRLPLVVIGARQSRSGEEQQSESSVQEQSKPLTGFFWRLFYGRGG